MDSNAAMRTYGGNMPNQIHPNSDSNQKVRATSAVNARRATSTRTGMPSGLSQEAQMLKHINSIGS